MRRPILTKYYPVGPTISYIMCRGLKKSHCLSFDRGFSLSTLFNCIFILIQYSTFHPQFNNNDIQFNI